MKISGPITFPNPFKSHRVRIGLGLVAVVLIASKGCSGDSTPSEYFGVSLVKTVGTSDEQKERKVLRDAVAVAVTGARSQTGNPNDKISMVTAIPLVHGVDVKQIEQTTGGLPCNPPACDWEPGSALQKASEKTTSFEVKFEIVYSGDKEPFSDTLTLHFETRKNADGSVEFKGVTPNETDGLYVKEIGPQDWYQKLGMAADAARRGDSLPHATFASGAHVGLPQKDAIEARLPKEANSSLPGVLGF